MDYMLQIPENSIYKEDLPYFLTAVKPKITTVIESQQCYTKKFYITVHVEFDKLNHPDPIGVYLTSKTDHILNDGEINSKLENSFSRIMLKYEKYIRDGSELSHRANVSIKLHVAKCLPITQEYSAKLTKPARRLQNEM